MVSQFPFCQSVMYNSGILSLVVKKCTFLSVFKIKFTLTYNFLNCNSQGDVSFIFGSSSAARPIHTRRFPGKSALGSGKLKPAYRMPWRRRWR